MRRPAASLEADQLEQHRSRARRPRGATGRAGGPGARGSSRPVASSSTPTSCIAKPIRRRTSRASATTSKPGHRDGPAGRAHERTEHAHRRRLAGPVRAEDAEDLAAADAEGVPRTASVPVRVALGKALSDECIVGHGRIVAAAIYPAPTGRLRGAGYGRDVDFRVLGSLQVIRDDRARAPRASKERAVLARLLLDPGRTVSPEALLERPGRAGRATPRHARCRCASRACGVPRAGRERGAPSGCWCATAPATGWPSSPRPSMRTASSSSSSRANSRRRSSCGARRTRIWSTSRPRRPRSSGSRRSPCGAGRPRPHARGAPPARGGARRPAPADDAEPLQEEVDRVLALALYRSGRQVERSRRCACSGGGQRARLAAGPTRGAGAQILDHDFEASGRGAPVPRRASRFVGREDERRARRRAARRRRLVTIAASAAPATASRSSSPRARRALPGWALVVRARATDTCRGRARRDRRGRRDRARGTAADRRPPRPPARAARARRLRAPARRRRDGSRAAARRRRPAARAGHEPGAAGRRQRARPATRPGSTTQRRASCSSPARAARSRTSASRVAEICRRMDGLPWRSNWPAGRTRSLTATEIAARVGESFQLLAVSGRRGEARHDTLPAAINWSTTCSRSPSSSSSSACRSSSAAARSPPRRRSATAPRTCSTGSSPARW